MNNGRVIFGRFKRRLINLPEIKTTRPTTDLLKESMFNCLLHRFSINFEEYSVIDLFAGSGSLGIESVSLGSKQVLFFENNSTAFKCIKKNINELNISDITYAKKINVNNINWKLVFKYIKNNKVIVFMDPPYKEIDLLKNQINIFKNFSNSTNNRTDINNEILYKDKSILCEGQNLSNNQTNMSEDYKYKENNTIKTLFKQKLSNNTEDISKDFLDKEENLLKSKINIFKNQFEFLLVIETKTSELFNTYNPYYVLNNRGDKSIVFIK